MKDIILVTNYWHFETEKSSSRYLTLAQMIAGAGYKLEVITSNFYHAQKQKRDYEQEYLQSFPYQITLIEEPGYKHNISIQRFMSQKVFGKNVLAYLKKRKKPDLIYCVIPSLEVASLVTKYAKKNKIRIILDIQDLWPEAFFMALPVSCISRILLYPLKQKANHIYSRADEIIAVSNSYVNRALEKNKVCEQGHGVYLGLELEQFDLLADEIIQTNQEDHRRDDSNDIRIAYVGSLGFSYDLKSVIDALVLLREKGFDSIRFIIMGEGPRRKELEEYASRSHITCEFTGMLPYKELVPMLCNCDIAVNPIVKHSAASIINKHAEYAAAGLAVLNTQTSSEYMNLLEEYHAGINCINGDIVNLADKIQWLIENPKLRIEMGANSRRLAVERFDRKKTYKDIISVIESNTKDPNLEVLVSTMNQQDYSLVSQMNIQSDTIFVNQCDRYKINDFRYQNHMIHWISQKERGIGASRNTALLKAKADICLFADEDVSYMDGYREEVLNAFEKIPGADVIVFDIKILHSEKEISNVRKIRKVHRLHAFNCMRYGACRIAVRRNSILKANVYFSLLFGGGARFCAGEDSLFLKECLDRKLKIYAYPLVIANVDDSHSSWYQGVNRKLLIDKGALLTAAFPKMHHLLFLYYALKMKKYWKSGGIREMMHLFCTGKKLMQK